MKQDRFFLIIGLILCAIVLLAFAPSFFLRSLTDQDPLPYHFIIHGVLNTLWVFAFVSQSWWIRTNRINIHQKIGPFWGLLAITIVFMNIYIIYIVAQRPENLNSTEIWVMGPIIGNLLGVISFIGFAGYGVYFRRSSQIHKRLMILATISMMGPALDRLHQKYEFLKFSSEYAFNSYIYVYIGPLLLISSIIIYDLISQRRPYFVSLIGLTWFLLTGKLFNFIVDSGIGKEVVQFFQKID